MAPTNNTDPSQEKGLSEQQKPDTPEVEQPSAPAQFDSTDLRMRRVTLNVALTAGILASGFFGIRDALHHSTFIALMSLPSVIGLLAILIVNSVFRRLEEIIIVVFVALTGIGFLALLATQFPHQTVSLWCLLFPLMAFFLLGRKNGLIAVAIYNLAAVLIFIADVMYWANKYSPEYAIRFSAVLFVISVISYYFEASRARSHAELNALNRSLAERVEEKTKSLVASQERLREAEKMESIGRLAGGIAHDFNNQLAGIMAFADLIRITAKEDSDIRQYAENIMASSRRSADLTGQLLAFARKGNLLRMPVDVHRLLADLASLLGRTFDKRITVTQSLAARRTVILGDPSQLHSAFLNIAINARDAMPEGGQLTLTTENSELDDAYCKSLPHSEITPGSYLRLCISDTGCGMDKTTLDRVFEPFFTTKEQSKGTGMGLAAVYGTVRSHNGAITVYSEPGRGSTFNLYFPVLDAETASLPANTMQESAPVEKCNARVLLVDDEPSVLSSSAKLLNVLGCTTTVFGNGVEAVEYYRSDWEHIDVVILDMVMPTLSGKDTFLAMKEINPGIIALLASGYSINGEAQSILGLGVMGFIQKPFSISQLRVKIAEVMEKKG
jgi:signal transduction histidine kinase/CheY-like chemotaxis protein